MKDESQLRIVLVTSASNELGVGTLKKGSLTVLLAIQPTPNVNAGSETHSRKDTAMNEPHHDWSPLDRQSPYYVWHLLFEEEWQVIARHYPFSIRVLVQPRLSETSWSEQARAATLEDAHTTMQTLIAAKRDNPRLVAWVIMHCEQRGEAIREKPVVWYPSEEAVLAQLVQGGRIQPTIAPME